ncbi:hypothetical protein ABZ667_01885 [Streptomyces lavendulae]|uniref:hypothetical protein n=1 Tax=Streptomyces lavendulae TaxID=1914 RepID=UPI0033EB5F2B
MPIDPYAALNAMLRAEAARCSPPVRPAPERPASAPQPAGPEAVATTAAVPGREEEPAAAARPGPASPAA